MFVAEGKRCSDLAWRVRNSTRFEESYTFPRRTRRFEMYNVRTDDLIEDNAPPSEKAARDSRLSHKPTNRNGRARSRQSFDTLENFFRAF